MVAIAMNLSSVALNCLSLAVDIGTCILLRRVLLPISYIIFTPPTDRGWNRTEDIDSEGHRLVNLWNMHFPDECVFTCHIPGDVDTARSVGVYYPSEL